MCPYGIALDSMTPAVFWNKVKDKVSVLNLNSLVMADERLRCHLSTSEATRKGGLLNGDLLS